MRRSVKIKILISMVAIFVSTSTFAQISNETNTERYFESIKNKPQQLTAFLRVMPKGGDLHNHESGATYAESMLQYAYNDNFCIDRQTFVVSSDPKCDSENLLANAVKDAGFYDSVVDAWSMRHFSSKNESGHDHFFSSFAKFGAIVSRHKGDVLAEIVDRAGLENESYIELMLTPDGSESAQLGKKLGWNNDFSVMRAKLLAANFDKIIADITTSTNQDEARMRSILACDSTTPKAGCNVELRYLYQVKREQTPEMVFSQLLAGFEAAIKDKRIVGLNMVQPEDGLISIRDYKLQMQMIGYFHQLYPTVQVSLHAGELNDVLVPADSLRFHIQDAVNVAHANRIGHGVDIANEDNADALLQQMASQHVMVEINLSSNADILGIDGKDHPLPLYMNYGVPVSLSTDDEGVSRSNLTNEYKHAVLTFNWVIQP